MIHKATLTIPRPDAGYASKLCFEPPGWDVPEDGIMFTWQEKFEDGMVAELQILADREPEKRACWCQVVLLDDGEEVANTDGEDHYRGEWGTMYGEHEYWLTVEVEE